MIVCEVYHDVVSVKVIVKFPPLSTAKWRGFAANLFSKSFRYVPRKRYFTKTYVDKQYAEDRLQSDIDNLKTLLDGLVKIRRYKLLEERVCGDDE